MDTCLRCAPLLNSNSSFCLSSGFVEQARRHLREDSSIVDSEAELKADVYSYVVVLYDARHDSQTRTSYRFCGGNCRRISVFGAASACFLAVREALHGTVKRRARRPTPQLLRSPEASHIMLDITHRSTLYILAMYSSPMLSAFCHRPLFAPTTTVSSGIYD